MIMMTTGGRDDNGMPPASLDSTCAVCSKRCRRLRCSKCRQVSYCSVTCQRAHWKAGHRSKCGAISPQDAWQELQHELIQLSPEEAHRRYQLVQEEIKRLDQEPQAAKGTEQPRRREAGINNNEYQHENFAAQKKEDDIAVVSDTNTTTEKITLMPQQENFTRGDWSYVVEEMPNISSYQVTLWPRKPSETVPRSNEMALSLQVDSHGNTNLSLSLHGKVMFLAQFPGRLMPTPEPRDLVQGQSDCLSLRLQCQDSIGEDRHDNSATSLATIRSIACRYCEQTLLTETCNIEKVLPLPSGNWDEVTDYLICYNGQPAVDFSSSSTSAQEHLALEDSSVIVLHSNSVGNSICVLAVEGYGTIDTEDDPAKNGDSATCRGPRAWRDSVGGATLCCSRCCATLGYASLASPETFRLLKHRLSADNDVQKWESLYTCSSFVAREMLRYAECKAIYTFVVAVRSEGVKEHRSCLLLKLLSWDTRQAKSTESSTFEGNSHIDVLNFQKVLKVIYELVDDQDTVVHDGADPMRWTWGGVDLCCMPGESVMQNSQQSDASDSSKQARVASVRLWLSPEEWGELLQSLVANSKSFSKDVTDATIIVKLGLQTKKRDDDTIGLSALPLL